MASRMTVDHLFEGLIGALAERGVTSLSIRTDRLDTSMRAVFERLEHEAPERDLNLRFTVALNGYNESATVRRGLASASQRNLISLDNPEYQHVRVTPTRLTQIVDLDDLPGGSDLYQELATVFLDSYEEPAA
jgi:hypothetical protein